GGSGGGGGGNRGGSLSGTVTSNTQTGTAMGNFDVSSPETTNSNGGVVTAVPETLIPQPDVDYFTQGTGKIGGFSDISNVVWAQKAIVAMSAVGIINGKSETQFCPDDNITRAEFVKLLIGMLKYAGKIDIGGAECSFNDVAADAWYYEAVAAAVSNGIVTGMSETEFAPDANITRQDMAVMLSRAVKAAKLATADGAELIFNDEAEIAGYAADAVNQMTKAGIINGFEDGCFLPEANATRAQAAVMLYRLAGGE
ncbi:MAG: S-layer homology domain-containing protein, partial [bacterium]|nr:S-layer homology domain-containing protein [bacterium]